MSDRSLIEYTVEIEWQKPERPVTYAVIARSEEDAIEIARMKFKKGYVPECQILSATIKHGSSS